jgi:hypothetical protein
MTPSPRWPEPVADPLSWRRLLELNLFSATFFVFAALLNQFLLTLYTALLLKLNAISFQYGLFSIDFISEYSYNVFLLREFSMAGSKWSEEQIYFIFGTGPVILTALGFRVLFLLRRRIHAGWRTKLMLTWIAFVMVNSLPCSIMAGVFFYDGFGTAFHWMLGDYFARMITGIGVMLLLVSFSRFWRRLFLNTCYHEGFLENEYDQKRFVNNVFLKPWMFGFAALMLYNLPWNSWFWPAFLLSLGVLPAVNQTLRYQTIVIAKSDLRIFASRSQVYFMCAALVLLFLAGLLKISL